MKPKQARKIDTTKVSGFDVAQTPAHAVEPLLPYLNKEEHIIWESAAGPERLLAKAFRTHGFRVIDTDLLDGEQYNFFYYEPDEWNIQITNPPFSLKYKWLKRSFELHAPFILLAPYETTFAKEWQELFLRYHGEPFMVEVLSPERRINFKMPNVGWGKEVWSEEKGFYHSGGSAQMPTCWITWGLDVYLNTVKKCLRTYYVPMRNAKYDSNNQEIIK